MLGIHGNTCCGVVAVAQSKGGDPLCSADQAGEQGHHGDPQLEHCHVGSPLFLPFALPYPTSIWRLAWVRGRWVLFLGVRCPMDISGGLPVALDLSKGCQPLNLDSPTFWGMCRDGSTGPLNQTVPVFLGISPGESKLYHLEEEDSPIVAY